MWRKGLRVALSEVCHIELGAAYHQHLGPEGYDGCYKTCMVRVSLSQLGGEHTAMGAAVVRIRKSRDQRAKFIMSCKFFCSRKIHILLSIYMIYCCLVMAMRRI